MDASPRRRVLLTADNVGGVWTYALELAGELGRRGVRVALATMGTALTAPQRAQLRSLDHVTVHESAYKLEWMQHAWDDVELAGQWLLAIEREFQPDVVHLNQFAFGALPFRAPKLVVAHSCVLSWWHAVHGQEAPPEWDAYRDAVAQGLAGADLVVAPTRAMLQTLAPHYGWPGPGAVIANGRSSALFRPAGKEPFIFAAGRLWDEAKNIAALRAVAPHLPWPVRLAGSTSHPDGSSMPVGSLECLGQVAPRELAMQLGAASIYALPARYEPFGLSVLEAALSGCALVLGDIASLREIWGPAALYVAPDDHEALHTTLRRLIDDPARRQRLGDAARTRGLHFTPARMADAYLRAYAQLQPSEVPCA